MDRRAQMGIAWMLTVAALAAGAGPATADVARAESDRSPAAVAAPLLDLETEDAGPRAATGYGYVEWNGVTYFGAHDTAHGFELWRSDGTDAGTQLLADILPGPTDSLPRELTVMGDRLYFTAFDGRHGFGLWSTDGTSAGTRLVKGAEGDFLRPGQLTAYGATLLLTAGPSDQPALWRSDGTRAGTLKVLALDGPSGASGFAQPRLAGVVSAGSAWLMSRAGGRRVLWRTDGSAGGTTRVWTDTASLYTSWGLETFDIYAAAAGGLLFRGHDAQSEGLWFTDGTPAGTSVLARGSTIEPLAADWFARLGAWTYFLAKPWWSAGGPGYVQVWRTDGTPVGTTLVTDFGRSTASQLTASAGRLFLVVNDVAASNDGSGGDWIGFASGWDMHVAAAPGGALAVGQGVVRYGTGLSGGTVDLTSNAIPIIGQPLVSSAHKQHALLSLHPALACSSGACWFRAQRGGDPLPPWHARRDRTWRSDLTPAGTGVLSDPAGHTRGSSPEQFVDGGGDVYFATSDTGAGDWNGAGRARLARVSSGAAAVVESWPSWYCQPWWSDGLACRVEALTALPQRLVFFRASEASSAPLRLWTSDGDPGGASPTEVTATRDLPLRGTGVVNGRLVFVGQDGGLWATDGTKDGSVPLGSPAAATLGDENLLFTPVGGWLYFAPSYAGLWRTDGTPGSVQLVKHVSASELTDVAGTLYFSSGGRLWRSNGTPAGTVQVAPTQFAARLTAVGSRLFFTAWEPARGTELWTSDGTPAGTQLVADIRGGPRSAEPDGLVALGSQVFFSADNGLWGRELWVSDGTREGTALVSDIVPGPQGSLGEGPILVAGGTRVWFPAWTPQAGVELWSSDGTSAAMVQEIAPGAAGSHPRALTAIGSRLYFSADDGVHGQEPWSLPLP